MSVRFKKKVNKFSAVLILIAMMIGAAAPSFAEGGAVSAGDLTAVGEVSEAEGAVTEEEIAVPETDDILKSVPDEEAPPEEKEEDSDPGAAIDDDQGSDETPAGEIVETASGEETSAGSEISPEEEKASEESAGNGSVSEDLKSSDNKEEKPDEEEEDTSDEEPLLAAPRMLLGAPLLASPSDTAEVAEYEITGPSENYSYDAENNILYVHGDVTIKNIDPDTPAVTSIVTSGDCTVTLAGVNIKPNDKGGPGILIQARDADGNDANTSVELVLADGTENTVFGSNGKWINATSGDYAAIEVEFIYESGENPSNTMASLTISGTGSLSATGSTNAAGIGGSNSAGGSRGKGLYGNININGGNVTAASPSEGAGIGSSNNPGAGTSSGSYKQTENNVWGVITVNGGTVNASSGGRGAGIGGGNHVDSGKIVINDGTVNAAGHVGIGCGYGSNQTTSLTDLTKGPGYYYADVTINGGTITATARSTGSTNDSGAGIGGGEYSDAIITITGGTIYAYGGKASNSYHHGGAGIGGGYEGHAEVNISGGTIYAYGGDAASGIGSGATANNNPDRKGTKGYQGRAGETTCDGTAVSISGGIIYAEAGEKGGAGIGGGVGSDDISVAISGGSVTAVGSASSEDEMRGGAGIGGGYSGLTSDESKKYFVESNVDVSITGGTVIAIGGWGASGIGSGADNKMADTITVDADSTQFQAYSDGTKFAIDTRDVQDDTDGLTKTTSVEEGRAFTGNILQGTFVHAYDEPASDTGESLHQGTEGLSSIIITYDDDPSSTPKELTLMPDGYRSYATDVEHPGNYTVYSSAEEVGDGQGRYFSVCKTEQRFDTLDDGTVVDTKLNEEGVKYVVLNGKLSDNFYLFPVKTIVVEKVVEIDEDSMSEINTTVYFAIKDGENFYKDSQGNMVVESIEIRNGVPQGRAFFVDVPDQAYDVWEIRGENDMSSPEGMVFGSAVLKSITTQHGEDMFLNTTVNGFRITSEDAGDGQITISVTKLEETMINADQSFTLQLYANGRPFGDAIKINKEDGLTATCTVDKTTADGKDIVYMLRDVSNNVAVSDEQLTDEVRIINTYEVSRDIEISLVKVMPAYYDAGKSANATLVFKITVPDPDDPSTELYSNYFGFTFTGEGSQDLAITIPVLSGAESIEVEEVYSAGYKARESKQTIDLTEEGLDLASPIEVVFENTFSEEPVLTGGIINRYVNGKIVAEEEDVR